MLGATHDHLSGHIARYFGDGSPRNEKCVDAQCLPRITCPLADARTGEGSGLGGKSMDEAAWWGIDAGTTTQVQPAQPSTNERTLEKSGGALIADI